MRPGLLHDAPAAERSLLRPQPARRSLPRRRLQGDNGALHWAAMRGHVEVVKALLEGGAARDRPNAQGKLPLDLCQPQWSHAYKFTRALLA
jgi:ankyrin repeat protein